mmetsp:Transcript_25933/g.65997  ORF Transcript_25933/g.65997 Transcript_25933/m.65997 type:complete len:219 (+) Transcript_25933:300-956(+)
MRKRAALLAGAAGAQRLQDAAAAGHGVRPLVRAALRLAVGLGQRNQDLLRRVPVLGLARPRLERRGLQRAAVREGEAPGSQGVLLVQRLQVGGGLLLRHAARQEVDAGHAGRDGAAHGAHRVLGHVLGGGHGRVQAGQDHVGLKQDALQHDLVLVEHAEHVAVHALAPVRRLLNGVVAGAQRDLGLHNGHQARLLADLRVARQAVRVLVDGGGGGAAV